MTFRTIGIIFLIAVIGFTLAISSCGGEGSIIGPPNGKDKVITIDLGGGITMNLIEAGTFTMGKGDQSDSFMNNATSHQVTLTKDFYMGIYEITQEQFKAVVGSVTGNEPSNFTGAKHPVEQVTWYDAVEFCNLLSEKMGLTKVYTITGRNPAGTGYPIISATVKADLSKDGFRLPTEAEWEYACRAGTTTAWNYGSAADDDYMWYADNSGSTTHPVGTTTGEKASGGNKWGLYDMHGNVWEWCWDWYGTYASGAQTNPQGADPDTYRVVRGGSWGDSAGGTRSAYRSYYIPDYGSNRLGFRVVR